MSPQNDNGPQWKERFLLTLLQQRNYSERTLKAYGRDVERFIEFFGRNPADANAQDILRFTAHLKRHGLGNSTMQDSLIAFSNVVNGTING